MQAPATSGNEAAYKQWALEVDGVGGAKVYPLWNGNGTVKVLVVNSNMEIDSSLPATVAAYLETVRPIGAAVTVASPTGLPIGITANVTLSGSKTLAEVQTALISTVAEYLKSEVFTTYSVSYAKIGSMLLDTEGVDDYDTLLVNSETSNITIPDEGIPLVGTITLAEAT